MIKDEFSVLFARIDDLCRRAERGAIGVCGFLSPRERHFIEKHIRESGVSLKCLTFGGYSGAERRRAFILPEFLEDSESYAEIAPFCDTEAIVCLFVAESGYKKLSHRDYLGSVLSLGIDRSVVGDIVLSSEAGGAYIFCDGGIADFIAMELTRVGTDTVKVKRVEIGEDFAPKRALSHVSDTVASARVDCVVAALCSLSREKAATAVRSGLVEVEYETEEAPDRVIVPPCVMSVRGYGKFIVNSLSEHTRKGRIRLDADKYV